MCPIRCNLNIQPFLTEQQKHGPRLNLIIPCSVFSFLKKNFFFDKNFFSVQKDQMGVPTPLYQEKLKKFLKFFL